MIDLPEYVKSGEVARLIPVIADSRKEQRVTSVFLATLSAVPDFAKALMSSVGQRIGNRTQINSFTEVVLRDQGPGTGDRPDGLLILDTGSKSWSALIEAKIGSARLDTDQVQRYVQLARTHDLDAVITISNEFAARPSHVPVNIPKILLRKVNAFHWSWKFILTEAILLQTRAAISDPDQAFLLREFVRFASHNSIGIRGFERMPTEWAALITLLQGGGALKRNSPEITSVVSAWDQEVRDLTLRMSHHLAIGVENRIPRAHVVNQEQRAKDECQKLADKQILEATLGIPGAAADLHVVADLRTKTIRVGMQIDAPQDKRGGPARLNWLLRQLKQTEPENVFIGAVWPTRAQDTVHPLSHLRDDPKLIASNSAQVPRSFHIFYVTDDGRRFAGRRTFIEEVERAVPLFYNRVGQHLQQWQAKPPKPIERDELEVAQEDDVGGPSLPTDQKNFDRPAPGNDHEVLLDIPSFLRRTPSIP